MKYPMRTHKGVPYFVYPRKEAKGVFYYRFQLSEGAEKYHRSTRHTSLKEALLVATTAIDQAIEKRGQDGLKTRQETPFRQALEEWLDMRKTVVAPSTIINNRHYVGMVETLSPGMTLDGITVAGFHTLLNRLRDQLEPSASYWSNILVAQRQFFKWCIITGRMTFDPTLGYERPKKAEFGLYTDIVTDAELETLCAHLTHADELAIRWFRWTGTYPADFAFAEKQDFYLKDGILHLRMERAKNRFKYHQPLDGRIEPYVKSIWLRKSKPKERMFLDVQAGQPYVTWYYCLQKRLYKIWLFQFGKHKKIGAFRHTWITDCIERGVPEDVLLQWAGHSPRSTIYRERYLHRKSTTRYRYVPDASSPSPLPHSVQHD